MKEGRPSSALLLPLEPVGLDRKVDVGGTGEAARSKILGTSGQDLGRHGAEVEWPGGKSLVWSGSLAWKRVRVGGGRQGGAGKGILFG